MENSGICKMAGGLSTVMSDITPVLSAKGEWNRALFASFTGYLRGCGINLDKACGHRFTGAMCLACGMHSLGFKTTEVKVV